MPSNSAEYTKQYYEKNKERILQNMLTEVECSVCHRRMQRVNLYAHQKSKIHIRSVAAQMRAPAIALDNI